MSLQTRITDLATRIGTEFKVVRTEIANAGGGDMLESTYDTNSNGIVDNSEALGGNNSAYHLDRANHTGTQLISTVTGLTTTLATKMDKAANLSDVANVITARTNLGVYSTTETDTEISNAVSALVDGAPATLDTINELAAALGDNPNQITDILTALGNRLRFDAVQTLTGLQLLQGQTNLNVVDAGDIGDTNTNFVLTFETALVPGGPANP